MNKPQQSPSDIYKSQRLNLQNLGPEEEDDSIDIRALFLTVWRGKWIILVCTLFGALFGLLASSQSTPMYRSTAKVMFGLEQANVINLQQVVADQRYDSRELENEMQVLRSTVLLERVIELLGLDDNPEFNPFLRQSEPTWIENIVESVDVPSAATSVAINIGLMDAPQTEMDSATARRVGRLAVIENVSRGLSLAPVGQSRVIEISFISEDPNTARSVANTIAEQYIRDHLQSRLDVFQSATSWLTTRVEELRLRVQNTEEAIGAAVSELAKETGQSLEVTQSQLSALNSALSQSRVSVSRTQALYDRLTESLAEGRDMGTISEFRSSSLISSYRSQESNLLDERAELLFTFSGDNPSLTRVDQRLEQVRKNIADEAQRIVEAAELELRAAKAQEQSLVEEVRRLEEKALEQSGQQSELRQLEREAQASRVLYENFLGRLQETDAQRDLQEADARILSPAERPIFPERQVERRTQLIATVVGALAGLGFVFLLDRLNNSFRSPVHLEDMTGETLLGTLPAIGRRIHRADVVQYLRDRPRSSLVESVRNLRTSILFSNIDNPPKVVMFTSSVPREGKSTAAMLVAMTSGQMGKSTVIVDCDLRLPQLDNLVGAENHELGLMSVLEGRCEVDDAVYKDTATGVHVLTSAGKERSRHINAADVLSSRRFETLIETLSETYDFVVLDTPPTLVVADARIVARQADAVVYIVRWDDTPRGAVMEGLKVLRSIGAPISGVVMTQVKEGRVASYAYHGYNYYKGKYRAYYRN